MRLEATLALPVSGQTSMASVAIALGSAAHSTRTIAHLALLAPDGGRLGSRRRRRAASLSHRARGDPRIREGSERAFVYSTAVRTAHGIRRKGTREIPSCLIEGDPSPVPGPDQLADQKRAREALDAIIASMDVDARTVFVLSELDGFTTPEIAELLDVPVGTAASRLRRARERFQLLVRQFYGETP